MEIMSTGFLLLNADRLYTYRERDYVTSDGRYLREMTIQVSDNDEFDYLNQYWNFTEEQSRLFKAQETTHRVVTEELPTYDAETDTVRTKDVEVRYTDAAKPKTIKTPEEPQVPGVVSAVNDEAAERSASIIMGMDVKTTGETIKATLVGMGTHTSVHRGNNAQTRSGRVLQPDDDYRCHDKDRVFQQRLLVHDIHEINEKSGKGDPTREKFTERAGVIHKRFSCPRLFTYLRNHRVSGRQAIDVCYAKKWPYNKAQRADVVNAGRTDQENQGRDGAERAGKAPRDKTSSHRETKTFLIDGVPREIPVVNSRLFSVAVDGVEIYNDVDGELPLPGKGRLRVVSGLKEDKRGETNKSPTSNRNNKTSND